MGNEGGCNANNDEATCNAPLRHNMFEQERSNEIAAAEKRVNDNLDALERSWNMAVKAPINNQPLAKIECCQSIITGNIDAKSVTFNNVTNTCSINR